MAICVILTAVGLYTGNTSMDLLVYGIPAAFGELALHTAWVVKKAERENIRKNKQKEPGKDLDILEIDDI